MSYEQVVMLLSLIIAGASLILGYTKSNKAAAAAQENMSVQIEMLNKSVERILSKLEDLEVHNASLTRHTEQIKHLEQRTDRIEKIVETSKRG